MCRETIVYHVNSINYLYTPLYVASVFVVHYVMKIYFAGYELYLYASFEDAYKRPMDASSTVRMAILFTFRLEKLKRMGKWNDVAKNVAISDENCVHILLRLLEENAL